MANKATHSTASLGTITNSVVMPRDKMTKVCHEVMGEKLESLCAAVAQTESHMATFSTFIETLPNTLQTMIVTQLSQAESPDTRALYQTLMNSKEHMIE